MRKGFLFLFLALSSMVSNRALAQVFVRGTFDTWGTDYTMLSSGSLLSSRCVYMPAGEVDMKFANSDYSLAWGGGSGLSGTVSTALSANTVFTVTASAFYDVVFDSTALTYTVTQLPYSATWNEMYVSGDFNGWGTNDRMVLVGNHIWQTQNRVAIAAGGHSGKFRNTTDWSGADWGGATGLSGTLVVTSGGGPNITLSMAVSDSFTITFNDSSLAYSFVGTTASSPVTVLSGPIVSTSPATVVDSTESVTITFHPYYDSLTGYPGDAILRNTTGDIYIYTGALLSSSAGTWTNTNSTGWGASDPYYKMTRVDSNTYTYTYPNLRSYYSLTGTTPGIDSIALIFTSGNGDTQTSNIFIPVLASSAISTVTPTVVGPLVTTTPSSVIDSDEDVVIHFHPYYDTLYATTGDASLRSFGGTIFIYMGLSTVPSTGTTWTHTNPTWMASDSYYAMTKVDSNDYTYDLSDLRAYYGISADSQINGIHVIFKDSLGTMQSSTLYLPVIEPVTTTTTTPTSPFGPIVTTAPSVVVDSTESVTITFHPYYDSLTGYPGDAILRNTTGDIYIYTGALLSSSAGTWTNTNSTGWGASDPYYKMTRVDSNTYTYTYPNLRSYYSLTGTTPGIDSIALIFTSGNGDTQTSNIFIPVLASSAISTVTPTVVGPLVTTTPSSVIDSDEDVVIHFHPYYDTLYATTGDASLRSFGGTIFIYMGLSTVPSTGTTWTHTNPTWMASDSYYAMTKVDSNDYTYDLSDLRAYYGISADSQINGIHVIFKDSLGTMQSSTLYLPVIEPVTTTTTTPTSPFGPIVTTAPSVVVDSTESVTITFHPYYDSLTGYPGDAILRNTTGDIYIYTGALLSSSAGTWTHTNSTGWGASDPYYKMTRVDSNTYTYTYPNLRSYYSLTGTTPGIDSIALVFTSGNGDTQTSNIFIPVIASSAVSTVTPTVVGPLVTTTPSSVIDSDEDVVIHFHPYYDTLYATTGDASLRSFGGTIFIYMGLSTVPSTGTIWTHVNPTWAASGSYYAMTKVDSNDYTYDLADLRAYYGISSDSQINGIHVIFKDSLGTMQSSTLYLPVIEPAITTTVTTSTGAVLTTDPSVVVDSTESVTITFHPYFDSLSGYAGDSILRHTTGDIYIYTGALLSSSAGIWTHTNSSGWGASDPYYKMTRVDSNDYIYTFPDLRTYYSLTGATMLDSIALVFTSGNGDTQTSNIFVPVTHAASYPSPLVSISGPMVTTNPSSVVDSDEDVLIHFHPYSDTLNVTTGDVTLRNFGGTIFIYMGLSTVPSTGTTWTHTNPTWMATDSYYAMTKVDSNDYTYDLADLRAYYGISSDSQINGIHVIFKDSLGTMQASTVFIPVTPRTYVAPGIGSAVTTSIATIVDSTEGFVITFHPFWDTLTAYAGDSTFRNTTSNIYIFTGLLVTPSPGPGVWTDKNTTGWGASDPFYKMTRVDSNTYTYSIPDVRSFYGLAGTDTLIDSIALIFTSGAADTQTSDFFLPVRPSATEGVITVTKVYNTLSMQLVPNPATNEVAAIIVGATAGSTISIVNQLGECVLLQNVTAQSDKVTLGLRELPGGIYFVELRSGNKKVIQNLIKQ